VDLDLSNLPGIVAGGFLAAGAGWLQATTVRRAQREQAELDRVEREKQFQAEQKARRDEEVRVRADAKADEVIAALDDVRRLLVGKIRLNGSLYPDDHDERKTVQALLAKTELANAYLQQPLRGNIEVALRVLPRLDEMWRDGFTSDSAWSAGRHVLRYARESAARYLRGEEQHPRPEKVAQYERDLAELDQAIADQMERQIAEDNAKDAGGEHPLDT